ncbi:hypothetical protein HUU40_03140 [candidate division KSB1 bacterium]|nr:hypothetical protein [candidate division KSB1 bacterium]
MSHPDKVEKFVDHRVTYTLFKDGKFFLFENVPARVNQETGEQYFAPHVVERLQQIILQQQPPARLIQTPVYEYA